GHWSPHARTCHHINFGTGERAGADQRTHRPRTAARPAPRAGDPAAPGAAVYGERGCEILWVSLSHQAATRPTAWTRGLGASSGADAHRTACAGIGDGTRGSLCPTRARFAVGGAGRCLAVQL